MNRKDGVIPEGKGFELDYDKYGTQPNAFYDNAGEWWTNFCKLGEKELEESGIQKELVSELNGDRLMAMAVNHFVGENYKAWLDKKGISMLGGLTPRECLALEYGRKRLKMLFLTAH